ncbi:unnamed protein product [Clonostachys byssicola]|uniref:F-box domain-containing protein n=1 Tax=Clonostachys byssicola TaxID=160290 RepID=A0A9N9Y834_9HYPO|nr:unnamed protein product [Clonostachys byssicola]
MQCIKVKVLLVNKYYEQALSPALPTTNAIKQDNESSQHSLSERRIDEQCEVPQSQAMDLSLPRLRPILITHFTPELLRWIFGFFKHPAIHDNRIKVEDINTRFADGDYETLKSLRLVCSLFNQVATIFLMPILRVQIDKPSLDRIHAISRNPLLGNGLRGIQVRVACRFKVHVSYREEFFSHQRRHLVQLLNYHAFFLGHRVEDVTAETSSGLIWTEARFVMLERIRACVLACDRCLGRDAGVVPSISSVPQSELQDVLRKPVEEALIDEYQEILYKAYEDYERLYERDWPVVSKGLLVSALAKLLSGPSRSVSLSFERFNNGWEQHWHAFNDKEASTKWLARPKGLSEVSQLEGKPIEDELKVYSGLLWHLPIAISQTGSVLNSIELHGPLVGYEYNIICPEDISPAIPDQPIWDQLQMACRNLQALILTNVNFRYKLRDDRFPINGHSYEQQPVEEGVSIGKYIGTILSGKTLERVDLDASALGLQALGRERARCPLGHALSRMTCTNMRVVSLTNIGFSQKKLEAFCRSLNPGMQLLSLSDVHLTHGSWVPVLDLLRDLLNERWVQGKCQVRLSLLGGGEIEQLEAVHNNEESEFAYLERLMGRFMEYIQSQQGGKNPVIAPGVFS